MGFLEKFFGGGKKYPPLGAENPAAKKIEAMKSLLEKISSEVSDPMEVVPADDTAFVFIGNPNKNFGMAWVNNGKVQNFKTLADEKGIAQQQLILMHKKLQDAYHRSGDDKRYSMTIGGKSVVVTPSSDLAREVKDIIGNA
ncbi:MAG: hypothetical protein BM485_10360 [Desulfobulbaceae bacterium DB1]|nr:MAG: hypothetical protein BM485_10360 [Desulfobulbaceae bacterium DB1]